MNKHPILWKFWLIWVIVSATSEFIGVSCGLLAVATIAFISTPGLGKMVSSEGLLISSLLGGIITGAIIGIFQVLVLRKYFSHIKYWITGSIAYSAVAMSIIWQMKPWEGASNVIWLKSLSIGVIVGAIVGFVQWQALSPHFTQASRRKPVLWFLISPISMMCSFPLLFFGDADFVFNLFSPFFILEPRIFIYLGGFILHAAITGLCLVWLLQQRSAIAPRPNLG
ncbi:hypothetical protein [Pseudanabaena sp. 'Roaring Creek']|uniref:hypothetical protein n=1 Tax=Pseudanabaena sp. 'Roaring Creek' TaxID=1681830 RepID=UPI0006D84A77|nr:hypothetical protein [Pseudanabaena sp. 'Roaring Creek']